MQRFLICSLILVVTGLLAQPKKTWPAQLKGAERVVYKTVGDTQLHLHIFRPTKQRTKAPAVVFFFGGGWRSGTPAQFQQQCRYLASRGMVAMTAEYRIRNMHGTLATACVADGKSAVRWIRANAGKLGVDPDRIAAGGGSAGGHVAACTGVIDGFESKDEDDKISSAPNAMVLFNPPCVLAPIPGRNDFLNADNITALKERMGAEPMDLSPWHQIKKGQPPTLVLHGEKDPTVKFWTAKVFAGKSTAAGNQTELAAYPGESHGFFNYGRGGNKMFIATMQRTDAFFKQLGWLRGKPTIEQFTAGLSKGR